MSKQPSYIQTSILINNLFHFSDARLERLLVQRKFSIERTKQTIDAHFTIRDQAPELFENRDPTSDELKKSFRMM